MTKKSPLVGATVLFGAGVLLALGTAAASADTGYGEEDVDITVDVPEINQPGVLALTVAQSSTALTEQGSDALNRQFVGQLPTVTVTDTRSAEDVPEGAGWYVLGSVQDFVDETGDATIPAANLGWAPELVNYDGSGDVFAGEAVESAEEGGPGLQDHELLFATLESAASNPEGAWSATADLVLLTGVDVTPGSYTSTLTLSLFE